MPSNKNKLARLADDRRERNKTGTFETVSMEDRLARLEEDIRRLKVEYDIYFNGGSETPPVRHEAPCGIATETAGRRSCADLCPTLSLQRIGNPIQFFGEIWRRTLKSREEGRDAVTVSRATRQAETPFKPATFACADVRHDVQTVKGLYDSLDGGQA